MLGVSRAGSACPWRCLCGPVWYVCFTKEASGEVFVSRCCVTSTLGVEDPWLNFAALVQVASEWPGPGEEVLGHPIAKG